MADTPEQHARTEEPTPKRLAEARAKGDAPKSQEIIAAAMLAAGGVFLWIFAAPAARSVATTGAAFIDHPHAFVVDAEALVGLFAAVAMRLAAAGAGLMALLVGAALLANAAQARPVFTAERMKPKLSKLSPIAGAKRIFGPQGLNNFAKGVGKIAVVGVILTYALWPDRRFLSGLVTADAATILSMAQGLILKLLALTVAAMAVIAAFDYGFQRRSWMKRLMMTKEEVRRELKETEGDPQIRGRLRAEREARSRRRTLVAVADATVLIMNPTHFAVALKYEAGENNAPVCIAKGHDDLALRMRDAARDADVPVVQNAPLARALYAGADLDAEIPVEHFAAVAKIIGFIMSRASGAGRTLN